MQIYENDMGILTLKPNDRFQSEYPIKPRFPHFLTKHDYVKAGVKFVVPMTAKEIEEDKQDEEFENTSYFVEEKFDGTRGVLHFFKEKELDESILDEEELLLCKYLLKGSGFTHGKYRIYEKIVNNTEMSTKELADFLKDEYGEGGGGYTGYNYSYNYKGITIVLGDLLNPTYERTFSWIDVAKYTKWLVLENYYYPEKAYTRMFSRRESVITNWLAENTDLLPQIRDINCTELAGTIIEGEIFIPNQPFNAIQSVMNCKWDESIKRQIDLGFAVLHTFDIMYFKGRCVEDLPLWKRKLLLAYVVHKANSPYIEMVKFFSSEVPVTIPQCHINILTKNVENYPTLYEEVDHHGLPTFDGIDVCLSKKAYYEYIVMIGGEGIILKDKKGQYFHKRGREYQKVKKTLTREVIVLGFTEPTVYYDGKFPNDYWKYWCDAEDDTSLYELEEGKSASKFHDEGYLPVTKYYYENWVGNIIYGVVITDEEIKKLSKKKKFKIVSYPKIEDKPENMTFETWKSLKDCKILVVGECSGFDEETRYMFTSNAIHDSGYVMNASEEEIEQYDMTRTYWIGQVIEVKANEIFRDTGKMRHPRFLRLRDDKSPIECTWKDHIQ
jgi:ATP-dependent DNA ligase